MTEYCPEIGRDPEVPDMSEQGMIAERAFEYEDESDAEEFVERAMEEGFDTAYTEGYVHVEGPHREVNEFVGDPWMRELLGREIPEFGEMYMGDTSDYGRDEYASTMQENPRAMTDGGDPTPDPLSQDFYDELGRDGYRTESRQEETEKRLVTDGGRKRDPRYEEDGEPFTGGPETSADGGGYEGTMFAVDHESPLEEIGTVFDATGGDSGPSW